MRSRRSLAISNAGPLIHLSKINRLHLLKDLFHEVTIPIEVRVEAVDVGKNKGFPDAIQIEKAINKGWIRTEEVKPSKAFTGMAEVAGLQLPEVAVIYHAYHNHMVTLLDDDASRVFARSLGVPVRGSLGIILGALKGGFLTRDEALEALDRLADVMYLAPSIYKLAKREIEKATI